MAILITAADLLVCASACFIVGFFAFKMRRQILRDRTLYRFCQDRRNLFKAVREGKLNPRSLVFESFESYVSTVIHYYHEFRFNSSDFLEFLQKREASLEEKDFLENLISELKTLDQKTRNDVLRVAGSVLMGFHDNSLILRLFKYLHFLTIYADRVAQILAKVLPRAPLTLNAYKSTGRICDILASAAT